MWLGEVLQIILRRFPKLSESIKFPNFVEKFLEASRLSFGHVVKHVNFEKPAAQLQGNKSCIKITLPPAANSMDIRGVLSAPLLSSPLPFSLLELIYCDFVPVFLLDKLQ
jgi:hypothetical protein